MADTPRSLPAFASRLSLTDPEKRVEALADTHPDYATNLDAWTVMLHAFEGSGGFQSGEYLWPYTNEREEDYAKRKKQARYHNYVETIIDLYVQHVFTEEPSRQTKNPELAEWWQDVDGDGTSMSAFLKPCIAMALAAGHTGILMDKTPDPPTGPAKASEKARPFLTRYPSISITDWRTKKDAVTGVKLLEAVPEGSLDAERPEHPQQYLLWDAEGWARFDADGNLLDGDTPGLDLVPFEVIRCKRSVLKTFCGRMLFSNANIVKALFNRMSEEDQVLRDQAFSLLTVNVPEDGDVEQVRKHLGETVGTMSALVVKGEAGYISPDMKTAEQIRINITQIIRELYRVAHMRYERDSLQAESAEAIRLQFKELNEFLQGLAAELQRAELFMARCWFAWTSPTPEAAQAAFEAAEVSISYPDEFFLADLILDLDAWASGISMDLGETMTKRIKKRAVRRIEPEIPTEIAETIDQEIDRQPYQPGGVVQDAAAKLKQGAKQRLGELVSTTSGRSG